MAHSAMTGDIDHETALAMLRWQADAGVDIAVGDMPVNRFEAPAPAETKPQATPSQAPRQAPELAPTRSRPVEAPAPEPAQPPPSVGDLSDIGSLEALRERLEAFDAGALKRFATNLVFGDGEAGAQLMFVGEAPGAEEDRQGVPFIGPSGKLLERMLAAIGLERRQVYIANTLYWRPPGNRTPTPEERQLCLPFLMRQIELVGPKVIAPLGGPAAQTLLNQSQGITRLRGRWFEFETREKGGLSAPALPTFHPAFLLRQPQQKRQAWQDLRAIRAKLNETI